jgi:gamma-glutamylcyclotransferase (GGCT)/AIG2-like uncharacterized protein YtfP
MTVLEHAVFVYGTLKPGGHNWPRFCEGKVSEERPAKIRGELYDLHVGYPGMLLRGQDWVRGYVLTLPADSDFLELDRLEGFVPGRAESKNEYNRLRVPCFSVAGVSLGEVWAYEMTVATMRRYVSTRIEDGNWQV